MAAAAQNESIWCHMTPMQVAQELNVDPARGLSTDEALARLKKYGPNVLGTEKKDPAPVAWANLYGLAIPVILLVAALLGLLYFGNLGLSLLVAGLAIFSLLLGEYPEVKAGTNIASLQKRVRVRRDCRIVEIDAVDVVPGDIVILTMGSRVPADGRLYIAAHLRIDETALTGDNGPAWKETAAIENAQPRLDERINMAFMNSTVSHGYGVLILTDTGTNTEIGHISGQLNQSEANKKQCSRSPKSFFNDALPLTFGEKSQ